MPSWLEFHDSTLLSLTQKGAAAEIVLDAYVHRWEIDGDTWRGTGWVQPVRITVSKIDSHVAAPVLPCDIAGGDLRVGATTYNNMVRIPLDASEPVNLDLELVGGQEALEISGGGVRLEAIGEARYVEDLPRDFRPPTE